jgi:energy-coupling factor transporter ATP-binding protein EcfA2
MNPAPVSGENVSKDRNLPPMHRVGDLIAPRAPVDLAGIQQEDAFLADLMVKLAYTVPRFTTEWLSKQLRLSFPLIGCLLEKLCFEGQVEQLWQTSQGNSHYKITAQGREQAIRSMEICGYVGPAPVRMDAYAAMLRWQFANTPQVQPENVVSALSGMVLSSKAAQMAGLAVSSGRSLFIFGPPGNGKSSLGRMIHGAIPGDYWIPYAINIGENVIRLFDSHVHQVVEGPHEKAESVDQRWVRIRRPLVVVGGELTLDLLDLIFLPAQRYYEAPPHLKSNGGVFLVDDFGRERVSADQLLNRFITPMEHQLDYFTLQTGQKIQLPLRHVLIIATNLNPDIVTDPAFLRRMGYRIYLGSPTPEQYTKIFNQYAQRLGVTVASEVIDHLLERYRMQNRELRACEPRDLIERSRDICRFHNRNLELTTKVLDLAWTGYFGDESWKVGGKGDNAGSQSE